MNNRENNSYECQRRGNIGEFDIWEGFLEEVWLELLIEKLKDMGRKKSQWFSEQRDSEVRKF